ncbi:MAG: hypothetical protein GY946_16115 [bacterium]|nr:hypothetical protein [bacterium]
MKGLLVSSTYLHRSKHWGRLSLLTAFVAACLPAPVALAQAPGHRGLDLVCPLLEHERHRALEDYELELGLVENEYQSRSKVFEMVERLWAVRSVEREVYLDYRRLRDRTKVRVDRMRAQIAQQKSIVDEYELTCSQLRGETTAAEIEDRIAELHNQFRLVDCELLERDVEIAEIDYEYDEEVLRATRTLVESNIKTQFELVIEEYDLSQSKARVEGYRRRAISCRKKLAS